MGESLKSSVGQPVLRHRRVLSLVGVVATFAVSAIFGYFAIRDVQLDATWRAIRMSNYWWVVPSLAAFAVSILVRAIRWRTLFRPERRPRLQALVKATLVGYLFNSILPLRAGEAARIVALIRYSGTQAAEVTATVVVERILDVSSLVVLLFLLQPWFPPISWIRPAEVVAATCFAAVVALGLIARHLSTASRPRAPRWLSTLPGLREETIMRLARDALNGLAILFRARQALVALGWTFTSWALLGLSFWLLMFAFDLNLSFAAALLVVIATGLAFIVPAAPGAIGVFEAAGVAVMKAYQVEAPRAFGYVLVLHALNLVPFLLAGFAVLSADAWRRRAAQSAPRLR